MLAALKQADGAPATGPARTADLPKATIAAEDARPVPSPAKDLQASIANRLEQDQPTRSEVIMGLVAGVCGATWVTGLLIYATI